MIGSDTIYTVVHKRVSEFKIHDEVLIKSYKEVPWMVVDFCDLYVHCMDINGKVCKFIPQLLIKMEYRTLININGYNISLN